MKQLPMLSDRRQARRNQPAVLSDDEADDRAGPREGARSAEVDDDRGGTRARDASSWKASRRCVATGAERTRRPKAEAEARQRLPTWSRRIRLRAAMRSASGTLRSTDSWLKSRRSAAPSGSSTSPSGVFGFLRQAEHHAVVLHPGAVAADDPQHVFRHVRHPRERSTSDSLSFGLDSTEAAIILFGSRIRIARISRVPFTAAFSRCENPILVIRWLTLSRSAFSSSTPSSGRPRLVASMSGSSATIVGNLRRETRRGRRRTRAGRSARRARPRNPAAPRPESD